MDRVQQETTTEEPLPQSVGARLRQCREHRQLTLEAASEATKITKAYLAALEEERFQDLPAPVYLQGFMRTYASYLGLPAEELLRQVVGSTVGTEDDVQICKPQRIRQFRWELLLLPVVLLGALLVSTMFQHTMPTPRPRLMLNPVTPQPVVSSATVAAVQPRLSTVQGQSAATEKQGTAFEHGPEQIVPPARATAGVMLSMRVKRNSTVTVTIDEGVAQGYELTGGDRVEWKAVRTISLDLSDAGSVELELNGKPVKLQEHAGRSAYLVLDAHGIRH